MAILSGPEIARRIESGDITIDPFDPKQLNPNSYDVRLGHKLRYYGLPDEQYRLIPGSDGACWLRERRALESGQAKRPILRLTEANVAYEVEIPEKGLILEPGMLYLGATVEHTNSDIYATMVEGKSSLGRLGLTAHVCAGWGDVGWKGHWTLELSVVEPLVLLPGIRIAQLVFAEIIGERELYKGRYQGQAAVPQPSRAYLDYTPKDEKPPYPAAPRKGP